MFLGFLQKKKDSEKLPGNKEGGKEGSKNDLFIIIYFFFFNNNNNIIIILLLDPFTPLLNRVTL